MKLKMNFGFFLFSLNIFLKEWLRFSAAFVMVDKILWVIKANQAKDGLFLFCDAEI